MKTEIENIIYNWADEIPHILIRVINAITLSDNKEELRSAINKIAEETELDKFFAYGYGAHHFWLTHRKLSNGKKKVYRVRTQYVFEGVFDVVAESKEEARQKVLQNCGLVMGGSVHSTLPDDEINWAFDGQPNKRIDRITKV